MRLLYCLQDPSQELRFGFNVVKEPTNTLNIFYNISRLLDKPRKKSKINIEDKWILSKLNSLIQTFTEEIENLHIHTAARALQNFWLNDFSRRYIQMIRERLAENDESAKFTLEKVYTDLLKLAAPVIPFVTEKIWQNLKEKRIVKEESVHLCNWPKADNKLIDKKLEKEFENSMKITEMGLSGRDKAGIGLRWPLSKVDIECNMQIKKDLQKIIANQLNVKEVNIKINPKLKAINVKLDTEQTPELEAEGYAREMSRAVQAFRKELGLKKEDEIELSIFCDEDLKKMLEENKKFIMERTNSEKLEFFSENVTTDKERFKKNIEFKIKDKRGTIAI